MKNNREKKEVKDVRTFLKKKKKCAKNKTESKINMIKHGRKN